MKRLTIVILLACLPGTSLVQGRGKSYRIDEISIEASVAPDGSLQIEETIRYDFKGSFKFAFREIPLKKGERIEGIEVSDETTIYRVGTEEEPGTFEVSSSGDQVRVTWYYRAANRKKSFKFSYRVHGVVHRYPDVAELYYQFVGDQWDREIGHASVRVVLPDEAAGSIRAWAHGPLFGTVRLPGDGTVRLEVSPLPRRTYWEGRILFSSEVLAGVPFYSEDPAESRILAEEAQWAEEANRLREEEARKAKRRAELFDRLLPISIVLGVLALVIWFVFFLRFGKPYPQQRALVPGEVPSSHPPALVSYLMHRTIGGPAIVSTLIDLARRGFLQIREEVRKKKGWFGTSKKTDYRFELSSSAEGNLRDYERELLDFILEKAGDRNGFWMSQFKKTAQRNRSAFLKWFRAWKKKVEGLGKKEKFFEPYQLQVLLPNILCGVLIVGFGVVVIVLTDSPAGIPAIVGGSLQAILSGLLTRRTEAGQRLYRGWKEFKNHIRSTSRGRGPVSLSTSEWGQYIVAAVVLGMHKEIGKILDVSAQRSHSTVFPWYVVASSGESSGLSGLGSGISSMVTSVSGTMSSASGMGGGASGGGGGGSGGGGGGAG